MTPGKRDVSSFRSASRYIFEGLYQAAFYVQVELHYAFICWNRCVQSNWFSSQKRAGTKVKYLVIKRVGLNFNPLEFKTKAKYLSRKRKILKMSRRNNFQLLDKVKGEFYSFKTTKWSFLDHQSKFSPLCSYKTLQCGYMLWSFLIGRLRGKYQFMRTPMQLLSPLIQYGCCCHGN